MTAFYNEPDPFAAQWLRNLIDAGHIAPGVVIERDIRDIRSDELRGYTQCHFFAGIGIWSLALRRAGWPDDWPIWTGSCPCQPFSAAGQRKGTADERHLWPAFHWLIDQCAPPVVVGEQVASKDGLQWLDLVSTDLEASDYAFGASDLCAAGFQGAHIRQRLYFVGLGDGLSTGWSEWGTEPRNGQIAGAGATSGLGDAELLGPRRNARTGSGAQTSINGTRFTINGSVGDGYSLASATGGLADSNSEGSSGRRILEPGEGNSKGYGAAFERSAGFCATGGLADSQIDGWTRWQDNRDEGRWECSSGLESEIGRLADDDDAGSQGWRGMSERRDELPVGPGSMETESQPAHAPMLGRTPVDWLFCRDGKWRPVESGTFPLAYDDTNRVGKLRAYGNALDAETATAFIRSVMNCLPHFQDYDL